MQKIIAITNQKGGVGKTTTAVNLAASLGFSGKHTLLIDMDPQGNTTSGVGVAKRKYHPCVYDILINPARLHDAIMTTNFKGLDVLPSNMNLAGAEIELAEMKQRESRLSQAISPIKDQYDYIIIDCPPSLGLITANALHLANSVIVPTQCEYYSLEGLSQLLSTVRIIKRSYSPNLEIEGVLLTMFNSRLKLTQQVADEVRSYFSGQVFNTVIPRSVKLSEAPSFGMPVIYYDKHCKGAAAYMSLCKEILKNNKTASKKGGKSK